MAGPAANPRRSPVPDPSMPWPLCSADALTEKERFHPYEDLPFLAKKSECLKLKLLAEEREMREGGIRGRESTGRSMRRWSSFKAAYGNPRRREDEDEDEVVVFYINHFPMVCF